MEIKTVSGVLTVNKSTPYGKWLLGYMSTGAWSGDATLSAVWAFAKGAKPNGCAWSCWGKFCGLFASDSKFTYFSKVGGL